MPSSSEAKKKTTIGSDVQEENDPIHKSAGANILLRLLGLLIHMCSEFDKTPNRAQNCTTEHYQQKGQSSALGYTYRLVRL